MNQSPKLPFPDASKNDKRLGFKQHLLRLVGVLISLVVVGWMIVGTIEWLTVENLSREEIVSKTFSGRPQMQNMAAEEWMRYVVGHSDKKDFYPTESEDLRILEILETAEENRMLLLRSLARLTAFAPWTLEKKQRFSKIIQNYQSEKLWPVRALLLMSYAQPGYLDEADVEVIARDFKHSSATVRKTVAYLLGQLVDRQSQLSQTALKALYVLYEDSEREVRVNALLALAQAEDAKGIQGLKYWLAEIIENNDNNVKLSRDSLIYQSVLKVAVKCEDSKVKDLVAKVAASHSDIRLRRIALDSLQ